MTSGSLNGYDAVTFDGTGDYIVTNLSINESVFSNLTVIALYSPRIDDAGGVWGEDDVAWDRFILDKGNASVTLNSMVANGIGPVSGITNIFPIGTPVITTVIFQEDVTNGTSVYANNSLQSTYTSNTGPEGSNNFVVGDIGSTSGAFDFDGDITELIVYGTNINVVQKIIIENYLAAKYGLGLTSNDIYDEDVIGAGNFDHEVAGIGRIDASSIQNDAQGTGIVRILNPSGLDNNEFLIWGHDNGVQQAANAVDVPGIVQARFDRVWRVSEVNISNTAVDVGGLDIRFDLTGLGAVTASDLSLLVDTDNDGLFSDETAISGATDLGGGVYEFLGVTALANNLRFTLGTNNNIQTPLPIELINFSATLMHNRYVRLDWQTLFETNNDYFTLERSSNGYNWEQVNIIDGAGNSSLPLTYNDVDEEPYLKISYYRLKQTDFDGNFTYSQIEVVNFEGIEIINLFPNPSKGSFNFTINSTIDGIANITIYDKLGKQVFFEEIEIDKGFNEISKNIRNLAEGSYSISAKMSNGNYQHHTVILIKH